MEEQNQSQCTKRIVFDSYVPCEKAQENPCYPVEFTAATHQITNAMRHADSDEDKLMEMLKRIADFYQADRAHIIEVDWDLYIGEANYEYCAPGILGKKLVLQDIDISKFPRWHEATKQGKAIIIENIETISNSESAEYVFLKKLGVVSLLGVPLYENLPGYLVLTNPKKFCTETVMMSVGAYIIAGGFVKQKLQQAVASKPSSYPKLAPNELKINFFGGLEIITAIGALNEVTIKSKLSVELIAYLCLAAGRKPFMQEISAKLWPEQLSSNPGKQLANLVSRLKIIFGCICDRPIITRKGTVYELNDDYRVTTDLDKFSLYCSKAKTERDFEKKLELYHNAFVLYKGTVLPSCSGVDWINSKAQYYRTMFIESVTDCLKEMYQKTMYYDVSKLAAHAATIEHDNAQMLYYQIKAQLGLGSVEAARQQYRSVNKYLLEAQRKDIERELCL